MTLNKNEMSGMYKVAKTLNGDIETLTFSNPLYRLFPIFDFVRVYHKIHRYKEVITLFYPMHLFAKWKYIKGKWIVYDQKIPPPRLFKSFWKRQYIKLFTKLNNRSMKGADEYWELSEIKQKPLFKGKVNLLDYSDKDYAIYLGGDEDYKNVKWLKKAMKELEIYLMHPKGVSDELIQGLLSNAKILVTASTWEGYGRPVMEAESLGIPAVCFDTGTHKKNVKKGFVIENENFELLKKKIKEAWEITSPSATLKKGN